MAQIVPATAVLGPGKTGLTIGYRVLAVDGTVYSAFTTTGVMETGILGTYRVADGVTVPDTGGYIVFGEATTDYAEATVDSQGDIKAILVGTGTDIPASIAALNDLSAADAAAAVLASTVEGTYDVQEMLKLMASVLFGKVSGGGTATITFRDTGDSADRVIATVDSDGNRTAITLDPT